ncbi:DUF4129 domain-containing protein [Anatilimnocola floriformis]|uniref:DUF4129 domain-containing protein n=1 Tax=Anatilimnocola floriformis TaxID=2948575 RepID=UPI0020C2F329|nr:DUF4129 domain-containing protein [Anatilimnocola floriformis]
MSRRAPETLVDWLVVGIAPFLIMLLVGSLVFYLVEVFYLGEYQARVLFVLGMFVMATVCIARISMEEGAAYAAMYAAPLAIAVGLALAAFVQVSGPLAALGPMLNWGLMILIWWSANKLTWDCTLIEGSRDFTGQGLMQTTGLDRYFRVQRPQTAPATEPPSPPPDLSGTSTTERPASLPVWKWWNWTRGEERPHAPGVWVVYFSIAALPLFGLGQWFMPANALDLRRRAFWLLVVYVAAGLSLLMATSFLSLRRYLRQRNQEMPGEMAAVWLGTGGAIIAILLVLASLLPRPIPEYSITHLAPQIQSPQQTASRWGWGSEGAKKKNVNSPQTATKGEVDPATKQGSSQGKPTPNAQGAPAKNASGSSGTDGKNSGGQSQSNSQTKSGSQQNDSKQSSGNQSSNSKQPANSSGEQKPQPQQNNQPSNEANNQTRSNPQQQPNNSDKKSSSNPSTANPPQQTPTSNPPPRSTPPDSQATPPLPNEVQVPQKNYLQQAWNMVFTYLTYVLKWVFYLLVIGVVAYYAWQHREWLLAAWQQLLKELRELWAKWFGQKPTTTSAVATALPPPPKRFAEYADPFSSGLAARWTLAELVRYTFEALEARGREQNCPRGNDQTPLEYAAAVGQVEPGFAGEVHSLADLYGQLAFAGGNSSPQSTLLLQQLWLHWRQFPAASSQT